MLGAIAGDVVGSIFEHEPIKTVDFPLFAEASTFTDDTVLMVAVACAVLTDGDYCRALKRFGRLYPNAGYGESFLRWLLSDSNEPYGSWGNGAAMRACPVGFACDSEEQVLEEAKRSAEVTHDHPEGIKGAQATALAVFLARRGTAKDDLRDELSGRFGYDLSKTLDEIRPNYRPDISCQGSVPEAILAFLESTSFEDALRKAVSLGGDSDTQACIAGGIAEAHYGAVPEDIASEVRQRLPEQLLSAVDAFYEAYCA